MNRGLMTALLAGVSVALAVLQASAGARTKRHSLPPRGVAFVLTTGPHAGDQIVTDGGPNVPAALNGGRVRGFLVPQADGNEFSFHGRFNGRAKLAQAAQEKAADALPAAGAAAAPGMGRIEVAITQEEVSLARIDELRKQGATPAKGLAQGLKERLDISKEQLQKGAQKALDAAHADHQIDDTTYRDTSDAIADAVDGDKSAESNLNDVIQSLDEGKKFAARESLARAASNIVRGLAFKRRAVTALATAGVPAVPPPKPTATAPASPAPGTATKIDRKGDVVGTANPSSASSQGWIWDRVKAAFLRIGTRLNAIGPKQKPAGSTDQKPSYIPKPYPLFPDNPPQPKPLPTTQPQDTGAVEDGDDEWDVGFELDPRTDLEIAIAWFAGEEPAADIARVRPQIETVRFRGGSSFFAVAGNTAYGDHFDRGTTGRFRAFKANLLTGKVTELWRPAGGSEQPLSAITSGLAVGGAVTAGGGNETTYWWGNKHYVRFPGDLVIGMNDAGVGVGLIGPQTHPHAALFEAGHVYDLNSLIPAASGWLLTQANAINDSGVIAGTGLLNGVQRAFVLNLRG